MGEKCVVVSCSLPLATVLFLIFLVLKLTDHINWSWAWVFAPLWISVGLAVVVGFLGMRK